MYRRQDAGAGEQNDIFGGAKKLGFGMMRLPLTDPENKGSVDVEQVKKMTDLFLEKGFTYFDTAIMYCDFQSEKTVKKVLTDRVPRDRFLLATKLHSMFVKTKEDPERIFREQLEKTGAGYFDFYLLHGVKAGSYRDYEKFDCFRWLTEKKAQGLIRHMGFSFHDSAEVLDQVLTEHPEMEFVQLQINYLDWESQWIQSRAVYETARKHGVDIVVMEPVKGGTLARLPERAGELVRSMDPERSEASWAVRFAASLPGVKMVLSGMSDLSQMEDNVSGMEDFTPLTEKEKEMLRRAADIIRENVTVPCTGCDYCTAGCPMNIAIPKYFSLYNEDMREVKEKGWTANVATYRILGETFGKAGSCVECGQCESVCPQHLEVIRFLKDVAAHYGA